MNLNGQSAVVLFTRAAVEDLDVNDGAFHSRRDLEGGVLHVPGLFAEDGAQQLFFRCQLGFALGGDFAHENVVGLDRRTNADNAAFIQVPQHVFADVRDVAGDFFGSKLGVTGNHFEFFDVD